MKVALTIDTEHPDRPRLDPQGPNRILDSLAERGVRATFFVQGRWLTAYPNRGVRIAQDGHLIGCHSWGHMPMSLLSTETIVEDIRRATNDIFNITTRDPKPWYRLPFYDGQQDDRVIAAVQAAGYAGSVDFNVDTLDWDPATTSDKWLDNARAGVARLSDGDPVVVLMHNWPRCTAKALPLFVDELAETGASFVTIDALNDQEIQSLHGSAG